MSAGLACDGVLADSLGESFAGAFGAVFGSFVILDFSGKRQSLSDLSQVVLRGCDYNGEWGISGSANAPCRSSA